MAKQYRFNWNDLQTIGQTVLGRLKRDGDENALAVGLGVKNAHKRPKQRRASVVVIVKKCVRKSRLPKKILMGGTRKVDVYVGRGKKRRRLRLPTDVIEVEQAVPCAGEVRPAGGDPAASGVLLYWTHNGTGHWGLLTVGHATGPTSDFVIRVPGGPPILGTRAFATQPGMGFDAAVVEIPASEVPRLLPGVVTHPPPAGLRPRPFAVVFADWEQNRDAGICFGAISGTVNYDTDLVVAAGYPGVLGWPGLRCVIRVRATWSQRVRPFGKGNSGSPWIDQPTSQPTGMLIASSGANYSIGIGHSLDAVLAYLAQAMNVQGLRIVRVY